MEKNKKPVVVYLHRYPIEYESTQWAASTLMIELLSKKYEVVYLSMQYPFVKDKNLRKDLTSIEIPLSIDRTLPFDKWSKTLLYYFYLPRILKILKKLNPKFIICKEILPFVPEIISMLNISLLVDASDWWWTIVLGNTKIGLKIAGFIERREVQDWNKNKVMVIAHSQTEAKRIEEMGFNLNKIYVINHPLNKKVYEPHNASETRRNLNFSKNDFVFALHGIIHPSKGYNQLLDWWKKVIETHPNWKLLIIGGSSGEKWCRKRIKHLRIEKNVIMTGWLKNNEDVNKHLNASDVLLVTRRNTPENYGVITSSLYHSMLLGKPVIATGLQGFLEIIKPGVNGYVFIPDDYNSFKNVLEHVYSNPQEAKKVGKAGIKRGKECFDPDKCAREYVKIIENTINKKIKL